MNVAALTVAVGYYAYVESDSLPRFLKSKSIQQRYGEMASIVAHIMPNQLVSKCDSQQYLSPNFISDAVEVASPSVVNIIVMTESIMGAASSGSGFVLNKEGYVVTNAHVVELVYHGRGKKEVIVTMWDGKRRNAMVHAVDKQSDVAVLKLVDVGYDEDLPISIIGNSGKLRAGEFVVALGSPLNLQNSVTFGIVSRTARHASELGLSRNRSEYIQTDTSINEGNSGGPLVNLKGEVIGINSMKVQGMHGISFAIPIDTASIIINQLIHNKRVIRPYVGFKMAPYIEQNRASRLGQFKANDVQIKIVEVDSGSPAFKAGLQRGDTLVEVNNKEVKSIRDILDCIGYEIGKKITFGVKRGNSPIQYVTVVTAPENY